MFGRENIAVLRRRLSPELQTFCADTLTQHALQVRVVLDAPHVDVATLLPDVPDSPARAAFLADVDHLLRWFWQCFTPRQVGLRLLTVPGDMCRRFHVDYVRVRLLTTYAGAGTQWVADADVDRTHLGSDTADDLRLLLRRSDAIATMQSGDIGLFKGEAWPGGHGKGAVHRSPPPQGTRVLFSLEPIERHC